MTRPHPADCPRCKRCKRTITAPRSVRLGLGPRCYRKDPPK